MPHIYPSLLAADPLNLEAALKKLEHNATGYHVDIMDYHFVPNLGLSIDTVNAVARTSEHPIWIHLMVDSPQKYLDRFVGSARPGTLISFHAEIAEDIRTVIAHIKRNSWQASLALRPKTPIERAFPYLEQLDQVLIMSVEPGFSGQAFLPEVLTKIDPLLSYRAESKKALRIGMDGGITNKQIPLLKEKGVNDMVVGYELFSAKDIAQKMIELNKLAA